MIDPAEERANFISLHEVLFLIAKAKNLSPMAAAEWLALNLNKNPEWQALPFKWYSKTQGIQDTTTYDQDNEARFLIERLAETGQALTPEAKNTGAWEDDIPF